MRKHRPDFPILLLTLILIAISLVIIYAIGPRVVLFENTTQGMGWSENHYIVRHLPVVVISLVAMIVAAKYPYAKMEKYGKNMLLAGFGLCLLVAILGKMGAGIVLCDEGACRAFSIPILKFGFQPVELIKIGILFYFAWLLKDRKEKGLLSKQEFWVPTGAIAGATALIVAIFLKDFGSTVVIFTMMAAMILVGGVPLKQIALAGGVVLLMLGLLIVIAPHRLKRLASYNGDGDSYHITNSLIGMGTGGLFGVGLGNSVQTTGYLPEAVSDSIFSVVCEIWGFLGAMFVIAVYCLLLWRMLSVSQRTEDKQQALLVIGVFAWIAGHVIINVGGMTGIIPMKGITLPFLSYGGTSLVFLSFAVGLVLQISGWTKREKVIDEDSGSRRGQRRTRNAGNRRS